MADTLKQKLILHDVPDVLRKPLPAELPDERIRMAVARNYETALDYFRIDRQSPNPDQEMALYLLALVIPAFDWPNRRKKVGRPLTSALKCADLYSLSRGVRLSDARAREDLCAKAGLKRNLSKGRLENLIRDGKRAKKNLKALYRRSRSEAVRAGLHDNCQHVFPWPLK